MVIAYSWCSQVCLFPFLHGVAALPDAPGSLPDFAAVTLDLKPLRPVALSVPPYFYAQCLLQLRSTRGTHNSNSTADYREVQKRIEGAQPAPPSPFDSIFASSAVAPTTVAETNANATGKLGQWQELFILIWSDDWAHYLNSKIADAKGADLFLQEVEVLDFNTQRIMTVKVRGPDASNVFAGTEIERSRFPLKVVDLRGLDSTRVLEGMQAEPPPTLNRTGLQLSR